MSLTGLIDLVVADPALAAAVETARAGAGAPLDLTAPKSLQPFAIAALAAAPDHGGAGRTVLAVTATGREAEDLTETLQSLLGDERAAAYYPAWETLPHERLSPRSDTVGRRLAVLRRLVHPTGRPRRRRSWWRRYAACSSRRSRAWPSWSRCGCTSATRSTWTTWCAGWRPPPTPGSIWWSGAASSRSAVGSSTSSRRPRSTR